jgi:serine O-acetyltransferase
LAEETIAHGQPAPLGDRNRNPRDIGLLQLLAEDYRTFDRKMLEPGFAAVAVHRFANARWNVRSRILRFPITALCRLMFTFVNWVWGIDLPYSTKVGRRLRIYHHGGTVLGARAIGDDVIVRHNTTFGVLTRFDAAGQPIIGNRVDVGVGTCILGAVTIGDDAIIGANSLVIRDVPSGSTVMGVPARQAVLLKGADSAAPSPPRGESG